MRAPSIEPPRRRSPRRAASAASRRREHAPIDLDRALLCAYAACFALTAGMVAFSAPASWLEVGAALAIQGAVGMLLVLDSKLEGSWHTAAGVAAVVAYLISVALVRDGLPTAGFSTLALLPVTWSSLRGRRAELVVAIVGLASVYLIPALFIGGIRYPVSSIRAGVLLTVIATALGGLKLRLVDKVDVLVARLNDLARTDDLTGLPNRRAWQELLNSALATARRTRQPLVVMLVDLDSFKDYNDTRGHLAGDRLLRRIAATWTGILRDHDVLARWGGDEFCLLLPALDQHRALHVIDRMSNACPEAPFCAGIVQSDGTNTDTDLLARADAALYRAKGQRPERHRPDLSAVLPPATTA